MSLIPRRKRRIKHWISAYVDGELDAAEMSELGEHLVFDPAMKKEIERYERIDALTRSALAPKRIPDSGVFAKRLVRIVQEEVEIPHSSSALPEHKFRFRPALWASIGILFTAGITLAGLRRRGIV